MKAQYGLDNKGKRFLFAALVLTLASTKSWTQSPVSGNIDLAQSAPTTAVRPSAPTQRQQAQPRRTGRQPAPAASTVAAPPAPASTLQIEVAPVPAAPKPPAVVPVVVAPVVVPPAVIKPGPSANSIRVTVEATAKKDSVEKKATEEISIVLNTREETEVTGIDAKGQFIHGTNRITELQFSSASCTDCMKPKVISVGSTGVSRADLEKYAREALTAKLMIDVEKEIEATKHRGNLEARRKRAERCSIRIVDENDKRQDVKLRNAERVECLADNLEKQEFASDNAEYNKVKSVLGAELRKMAFNNDEDVREEALDLVGDLQGRFDNERLEDYFGGMERGLDFANSDIERFYNDLDILENEGERSPEGLAARHRMMIAQRNYRFARSRGSNSVETSGLDEIRKGMLAALDETLRNPNQFIADNSNSVMDFTRDGGAQRRDIGMDRFPRLSFDGQTSHRSGGQNMANGNRTDPRMDPRFQNRPGYNTGGGQQFASGQPGFNPNGNPNVGPNGAPRFNGQGQRGRQAINGRVNI